MFIGTENRLFERIDGELAVRYSPQGSNREFCTTTKNISGGGVRISLLRSLSPGTILDLEIFKYSSDFKTRCRGKVAWIWDEPMDKESEERFEAGIQFLDRQLLYVGRLIGYLEEDKDKYILLHGISKIPYNCRGFGGLQAIPQGVTGSNCDEKEQL